MQNHVLILPSSCTVTHTTTPLSEPNLLITGGGEKRRGRRGRVGKQAFPMSLTHCHIRSIYRQKLSFCFSDLPCVLSPPGVMQQAVESIPAIAALKDTFGKLIS